MKLSAIAKHIQGELAGDGEIEITGIAPIDRAISGQITFIANKKYKKYLKTTKASAAIVPPEVEESSIALIKAPNPYLAYARVAQLFYKWPYNFKGISPQAVIGKEVKLGENVTIYPLAYIDDKAQIGDGTVIFPGVYIGPQVKVGRQTIIYPNAVVLAGCEIGDRVVIHSGVVIGSDGFGFAPDEQGRYMKIPQLGIVKIDDDVEIGANTTIDRAALGETVIKKGTKIDNLVQIGHNVQVGADSVIVAQVGIAGSTRVGNRVTLAGQVGVVGHIEIGDGVKVGAKTGVNKSIPANTAMASGVPAMPYQTYLKTMAILPKLPELLARMRMLEKELTGLKKIVEGSDEE
ncbi:MAG: UDP-3-O-(3-hydroxymyristoyl)glucosamine N-acyltransferase [Candidatus Desulfofervidaceae bacterium]|nr:UDP-3-O-(3-hydroxymyristoyl)glucosamine N-acyltransferase [Candidatus Desulfofervidaceae bacterium]